MLRIRELSDLARGLDAAGFEKQMGPFALMQRPASEARAQEARAAGFRPTARLVTPGSTPAPVDFEELLVAMLPPVSASGKLQLVIGRSPDCDLVIEDQAVSSRHAIIEWNGTGGVIVELGSSNGTFLNGKRMLKDAALSSGDQLAFGVSYFIYLLAPALHERMRRAFPPAA